MPTEINPTVECARLAAEAIRNLNHRTLPPAAGFTWPSDAYATIGELTLLAHRMPQALEQIAAYLAREHLAGRIVADWGSYAARTDQAVEDACDALISAAAALADISDRLDRAHIATAGLAGAA